MKYYCKFFVQDVIIIRIAIKTDKRPITYIVMGTGCLYLIEKNIADTGEKNKFRTPHKIVFLKPNTTNHIHPPSKKIKPR